MIRVNKLVFNKPQREETAKMLTGICQVILLAVVAGPYIGPIAKRLNVWDNIIGIALSLVLYYVAMFLLKEVK